MQIKRFAQQQFKPKSAIIKKKHLPAMRILLPLIFVLLALPDLFAQLDELRPDPRRNVLKMEVLPTIFGSYGLYYERMIGESASITNGIEITYIEKGYSLRGLSYQFDIKGYLNYWRHVPDGYYLSAFVNARGYDFSYFADLEEQERVLERTSNVGLGLGTGNQWLFFNNRLALDLGLGFGYFFRRQTVTRIKDEIGIQDDEPSNVIMRIESSNLVPDSFRFQIGLALGFAF